MISDRYETAERLIVIGDGVPPQTKASMRLILIPAERDFWREQVREWLNAAIKYDSTTCAVLVAPALRHWPEMTAVVEQVAEHYKHAHINQNTVEHVGPVQGRNFICNLRRIAHSDGNTWRDARSGLPSMAGQTAIVCGAGPSFDASGALLGAHRGPLIAVNTSAGCMQQHDLYPDVTVCIESKLVREGVARVSRGQLALDLTAHPDNTRTLDESERSMMPELLFVGTEPNLAAYAKWLGLLPLAYGGSCTTAAVSLALACGAERVALVGQDCAFLEADIAVPDLPPLPLPVLGARMYASGTPYEETTVVIDTANARARIDKPTVGVFTVDAIQVPAVQGGMTWTTHTMYSVAHWFRDQPDDVRKRIVNCTASGAYIEGIEHKPLAQVMQTHGDSYAARYDPYSVGRHAGELLREHASKVLRHIGNFAKHGVTIADDAAIIHWTHKHPLLQMWLAPERLRMRRLDLSPTETGARVAEVTRTACREIYECATGVML